MSFEDLRNQRILADAAAARENDPDAVRQRHHDELMVRLDEMNRMLALTASALNWIANNWPKLEEQSTEAPAAPTRRKLIP